ncbi:membrane protein insertion efficiency factor YidD [Candidatus Nomurabacteria bacterium]|nr:membrane protein insertion efficiency factor YidD [Candidatus Nomurabacteria bacterium]
MSSFLVYLIIVYQNTLSPFLYHRGVRCRFYPSCSEYGILAIEKYGSVRGTIKTFRRIHSCRPNNFSSCIDFP